MDFDEIVVKEGPGLCRCCLSEGCYKDLATEYAWMNETEVYADMLLECFDISISQHSEGPNGPNRLICEVCITRLRDACNFKKQVLDSEKKFVDMVGRGDFKTPVVVFQQDLNTADNVPTANFDDAEYLDEDNTFMDDDIKKLDETEDQPCTSDITVTTLPVKAKRGRPRKNASIIKTEKKSKLSKVAKSSKSELKSKAIKDPELASQYSVVQHGNSKKYMCLKCNKLLSRQTTMRGHFARQHFEVKCPLCDKKFQNLSKKNQHLIQTHGMEEYGCKSNENLRPHKQHVCQICNKGLTNQKSLKSHISTLHKMVKCPDCDLLAIRRKLPQHRHEMHGHPIPTCGICGYKNGKRFNVILHQRKVHLQEKNVSCEHCGKEFFHVAYLRRHLVKHTSERKFECSYCYKRFPRKPTLELHEKIHTGEKNKVCAVCSERFVQKASLNYHMARHHPGVSF